MELIRPDINFNFVGMRFKAFLFSLIVILLGMIVLVSRGGLNLGVDFAGGTLVQVQFKRTTDPEEIRGALKELISQGTIQEIGGEDNEFLIRTEAITSGLQSYAQEVQETLGKVFGKDDVTVRRVEMVGPKVGQDLRQKALFAIYYALILITIYISGRFEFRWTSSATMGAILIAGVYLLQTVGVSGTYVIVAALVLALGLCWKLKLPYALGAIMSLAHDVLITVGIFALADKEFTLEVLAALLTLVGFSLNDTIVIFDRIRENTRKGKRQDLAIVINQSINQTLSRTILTNGTVFFVIACLLLWGGTVIHDFAFAMFIGTITGTYSTIFVASPILLLYDDWTKRRVAKRKPVPKSE
ncbi:MAG: protein translocase subunit SecF [Desulforhabdus sp.]|jgi:preprotein translocase subunit SecF|nr:protein translocase subunit SecF [Desulforhabdus sp.]